MVEVGNPKGGNLMEKVGVDRVIQVLEEEINRIDSYCDDFTRDYSAWGRMENELERLQKILAFTQNLKAT